MTVSEGFAATAVLCTVLALVVFIYTSLMAPVFTREQVKDAHSVGGLLLGFAAILAVVAIWTGVMLS